MKVLIAEDDAITNKNLANSLSDWGHDVISVTDGIAAWEVLQEDDAPRLAILDWDMPGMDGLEICRNLRLRETGAYTYLILLTGKTEEVDVVAGLKAGADDYLSKPFNPKELEVRLQAGERIVSLESNLLHTLNQLKDYEEKRSDFIAALTHDLRTPLIAEQRALEVLQDMEREVGNNAMVLIKSLLNNNKELLTLVNHLLETFHAEKAPLQVSRMPTSLHATISDCLLSLESLATPKRIHIVNAIPETFPPLLVDPEHLKRIITNLVSNAITNVPEGSQVEVFSTLFSNFIEIRVKDNGPGIHPDMLPHIFERYYNGMGQFRKIGSGLGLSICKTLVELQGGRIWVESALGQGTCFSFSLPLVVPEEETFLK